MLTLYHTVLSFKYPSTSPRGLVHNVEDLRIEGHRFKALARPIFFLRIDDSHCNRIHSSLTAICCFDNGSVRKQPVALKEYLADYCVTEITLKTLLTLCQMINLTLSKLKARTADKLNVAKMMISVPYPFTP